MFDTQKNESINQQISRFVPQLKDFGTTIVLNIRIVTFIGIVNYGNKLFYERDKIN